MQVFDVVDLDLLHAGLECLTRVLHRRHRGDGILHILNGESRLVDVERLVVQSVTLLLVHLLLLQTTELNGRNHSKIAREKNRQHLRCRAANSHSEDVNSEAVCN